MCAAHLCGTVIGWRVAACGCGGSERHQAQDPLLQNRIDLSGGGVGYGGQICPGARVDDGLDQPYEEVWPALSGSSKGIGGMSDERHGWSLAFGGGPSRTLPAPFFFCSAAKV